MENYRAGIGDANGHTRRNAVGGDCCCSRIHCGTVNSRVMVHKILAAAERKCSAAEGTTAVTRGRRCSVALHGCRSCLGVRVRFTPTSDENVWCPDMVHVAKPKRFLQASHPSPSGAHHSHISFEPRLALSSLELSTHPSRRNLGSKRARLPA
jgi:hypothetical protein